MLDENSEMDDAKQEISVEETLEELEEGINKLLELKRPLDERELLLLSTMQRARFTLIRMNNPDDDGSAGSIALAV